MSDYEEDRSALKEIRQCNAEIIVLKHDVERLTERCAMYKGQVEAGAHEIERLTAESERLRAALRDVIDPLGSIRRDAESRGLKLNGMAYSVANDLGFVQKIAKDALSQQKAVNSEEGK